jgi:Cysteine dioxygenase type I
MNGTNSYSLSCSRLDVAAWAPTWAQTSSLWSTTTAAAAPLVNATNFTCSGPTTAAAAAAGLPYTRNLIATDGVSFSLLLLCWNPNCYSPIHNHPGDGCWMRVVSGAIHEARYTAASSLHVYHQQQPQQQPLWHATGDDIQSDSCSTTCGDETESSLLRQTHQRTLGPRDDVVFIADDLGYHKVGNPSSTIPAMSLHLYSPPPQSCRAWVQEDSTPYQTDLTGYHSIVPT